MATILTIAGVDRTYMIAPKSLKVTKQGAGVNNLGVRLNATAADFIPKSGMEVVVYEDAAIRMGGIIKTVQKLRVTPEFGTGADIEATISADGYNEIPSRRTCTCEFFNKTAGYIVEKMRSLTIDAEGVGAGTINAGITIPYYLMVCKSLKEIYDDLAASSGYKWYIDESKDLDFIEENAIVDADEDIVEEGTFTDFNDIIVSESLADYRNKTFVCGKFGPDGNLIVVYSQDSTEIAARQVIEGGTGVYGHVIQDDNVATPEDALILAELDVKKYAFEPAAISLSSYKTDWVVGTRLKVNLPSLGIPTDIYFLIEEVNLFRVAAGILKTILKGTKRRAGEDFSNQKTQTGTDYFVKVVREAKKNGGSYSGGGSALNYRILDYPSFTDSQKTLTSVESLIMSESISIDIKSDIKIFFSCSGESDAAMDVTLKIYVDGIVRTYQPVQTIVSGGKQILTISDTIIGEEVGYDLEISIWGVTSAGNFVIAAGFATLDLMVIPSINTVPLMDVSDFEAEVIDHWEIDLTWDNPNIPFIEVELYRSEIDLSSYDRDWCNGNADFVYNGRNENYNDTGLSGNTLYYYKIFVSYSHGYSNGILVSGTTDVTPGPVHYTITELESLEHETTLARENAIARINDTHFMVAYRDSSNYLRVKTFSVDGSYAFTQIDNEANTGVDIRTTLNEVALIQMDATHYVFSAPGDGSYHGRVGTITIDGGYNITFTNTIEPDGGVNSRYNSLCKVDSTHFCRADVGANAYLMLTMFSVDGSWNITKGDELSIWSSAISAGYPDIALINSTHMVVAFNDSYNDARISTILIDGSFILSELNQLEYSTGTSLYNQIKVLNSTHCIVAGKQWNAGDGYLTTFSWDGSFIITEIAELEFDIADAAFISMELIDATHVILTYSSTSDVGIIKTFTIDGSYAITQTSSVEFDTTAAKYTSISKLDILHYIVAYTDTDSDGKLTSFSID